MEEERFGRHSCTIWRRSPITHMAGTLLSTLLIFDVY